MARDAGTGYRFNLMGLFALLCNEPWCWTPREVCRHTDLQLWELVINPALRRAGKQKRRYAPRKVRDEDVVIPTKEQYVAAAQAMFGDGRDWGAEFDRMTTGGGDCGKATGQAEPA